MTVMALRAIRAGTSPRGAKRILRHRPYIALHLEQDHRF
jgi:hypothetical protein